MEDWRLQGQENYLTNASLLRIRFPEFWQKAYQEKNLFYQKIADYAEHFVATMNRGQEYLEGEKIQHFWHQHCAFCWEKALTDKDCEFYCTPDYRYWICSSCFHDFRDKFQWTVKKENNTSYVF